MSPFAQSTFSQLSLSSTPVIRNAPALNDASHLSARRFVRSADRLRHAYLPLPRHSEERAVCHDFRRALHRGGEQSAAAHVDAVGWHGRQAAGYQSTDAKVFGASMSVGQPVAVVGRAMGVDPGVFAVTATDQTARTSLVPDDDAGAVRDMELQTVCQRCGSHFNPSGLCFLSTGVANPRHALAGHRQLGLLELHSVLRAAAQGVPTVFSGAQPRARIR
ncbi:hypothetical protein FGB62_4g326 [Gracilaria domingensis]|nr:hypothetical protein FGB62_4g326 [Gracilaria domingensis]